MNPCDANFEMTVLPECPACAEAAAEPIALTIEYGPGPVAECLPAWMEQQRFLSDLSQRLGVPARLFEGESSNYAGVQAARELMDRLMGIPGR